MARQIRKSYYPGWPNFLTKMIRRTDPVIPNGTYLGKTVVLFDGFYDERLGKDNTLDGPESKHATATVYGANGR